MAGNKDIEKLQAQLDDMANTLKRIGEQRGEDIIEEIEEKRDYLKDRARQRFEKFVDDSKETSQKAKKYVEENPWQSAAVAITLGFLAGVVAGSSKRD